MTVQAPEVDKLSCTTEEPVLGTTVMEEDAKAFGNLWIATPSIDIAKEKLEGIIIRWTGMLRQLDGTKVLDFEHFTESVVYTLLHKVKRRPGEIGAMSRRVKKGMSQHRFTVHALGINCGGFSQGPANMLP